MVAPSPPEQLASNEPISTDRVPTDQDQHHVHDAIGLASPNRCDGLQCCYEPLLPATVPWSTEIPWLANPNTSNQVLNLSSGLYDPSLMDSLWPVSAEANQAAASQLTGAQSGSAGMVEVKNEDDQTITNYKTAHQVCPNSKSLRITQRLLILNPKENLALFMKFILKQAYELASAMYISIERRLRCSERDGEGVVAYEQRKMP
ncbi:hypothetical protein L1987_03078 [Smallanthus sonchifolius]|uniref:Uncharacterized protein n=1 Tax=Smallanthus sonchifolius TaxID=185202 RepID=A0ACB9K9K7_9ASTR|nr:hypothetical protein L1987_03078 [Smallanthus sonchifolius]